MKFEELNLKPELLKAVLNMGFTECTEIQEKCIPAILSGKDIVGQSQTGSGKTAAFGLPMLNNIVPGHGVQAIILTPTRELGVQVFDALREFGRYLKIRYACVYGGVAIGPQIDALRTADIVVGTPGRVLDHLARKTLMLDKVKYFVLDEADRMLEMGFIDDVKDILRHTPKTKHSLLFSATMPPPIKRIVDHNFNSPLVIFGKKHVDNALLRQIYYNLRSNEKFSLLVHLLKEQKGISLIFCATRHEVDNVTSNLRNQGLKAVAIHGGLTQNKRLQVVEMLRNEHVKILVATDVAARGLDIRNITHVFNYDLPQSTEEYTHRVGRTARAGSEGDAITLLTQNDYDKFSRVLSDRSLKIDKADLPKFEMVVFERPQRSSRGGFGSGRSSGGYGQSRSGGGFSRPRTSWGSERSSERSGSSDRYSERPKTWAERHSERSGSDRPSSERSHSDRPRSDGPRSAPRRFNRR